jgi:hypothetical protein
MGNHKRFHGNRRQNSKTRSSHAPPPLAPLERPASKPSIVYGKPFTLLEDEGKKTFEYQAGSWVPFALSIAECRQQSFRVDQLPQKVNRMTRYEIRRPVDQ